MGAGGSVVQSAVAPCHSVGSGRDQKSTFNPACTCLLGRATLPITPKLEFPSVTPGCPSCGVLNRLNASARNSILTLSRFGHRNNRCKDASVETVPGPVRMLRPALPCTYWTGNTKADVSNQRFTDGRSGLPLAIRLGQFTFPVLALSKLRFSVNGTPLAMVVIAVRLKPPA